MFIFFSVSTIVYMYVIFVHFMFTLLFLSNGYQKQITNFFLKKHRLHSAFRLNMLNQIKLPLQGNRMIGKVRNTVKNVTVLYSCGILKIKVKGINQFINSQ